VELLQSHPANRNSRECYDTDATERHENRCMKGRELAAYCETQRYRVIEKCNDEAGTKNSYGRPREVKKGIQMTNPVALADPVSGRREHTGVVGDGHADITLTQGARIV